MIKSFVLFLFLANIALAEGLFIPPKIDNAPSVPYTLELLKQAVDGNSIIDAHINVLGKIDSLEFIKSINNIADSIIQYHLEKIDFTPAYEDSTAVSSIVRMEFEFGINNALIDFKNYLSLTGIVLDSKSGLPIKGVEAECMFIDPTEDKNIKIPFDNYLNLISRIPGQFKKEERLASISDDYGRLAFYALPDNTIEIQLTHPLYKTKRFTISGTSCPTLSKVFKMDMNENVEIKDNELEIIVTHYKDPFIQDIQVEKELKKNGLTDDLSKVISNKSAVISSSQSGSRVTINGGGLYDNNYMLNGISIFSPTHFPFFSNLDKNGLILSDIEGVSVITSRIAGRYNNSSGGVINMNTEKSHTDYTQNKTGGSFDLSYEKATFRLSQIGRKGKDEYLLSYAIGQKALMKNYTGAGDHLKASADYGYADPLGFYDFQLKSFNKLKKGFINTFSWIGIDQYNGDKYYEGKVSPLGFGSISYTSSEMPDRLSLVVGGSMQYHDEGKRIGTLSPLKEIERKNAAIIIDKDKIKVGPFYLKENFKFEKIYWDISIRNRIELNNNETLLSLKEDETFLSNTLGISYSKNNFNVGIDLNAGTKFHKGSQFFDPGIWLLFPFLKGDVSFSGGFATSYPDMRGVPLKSYRNKAYKTYLASSRIRMPLGDFIESSIEPFIKYYPALPQIGVNPLYQIWDEDLESIAYIRGINAEVDFLFPKILTVSIAASVNKGDRYVNGQKTSYEWEIPWQFKAVTRIFLKEERLNFFLKPTITSGMPYYDYANYGKVEHHEKTFTFDAIFEYHVRQLIDTPIELMEAYIGLRNISLTRNGSEIFWAEDMTPLSYNLTPFQLIFGARAAIGKKWKK